MSPLPSIANSNRQGGAISNNRRSTPTPPSHGTLNNNRGWSASCLRPAPPLRPCLALGSTSNGSPIRSSRKPVSYKEDALILDVIEAYCSNNVKPRNTINSVNVNTTVQGQNSSEVERNLSESVQILQSQVKNLEYSLATLSIQLCEERAARCALQTIIKSYLNNNKDFDNIEWPTMESNILN